MTPRTFLRTAAVLTLVQLFAAVAHAQNALDDIVAKKLLVVAIPTDSAPYGFVGTDLKPQGLDIDTAELIAPSSA
jgi:polar amino acid transport system substrate-binding protein